MRTPSKGTDGKVLFLEEGCHCCIASPSGVCSDLFEANFFICNPQRRLWATLFAIRRARRIFRANLFCAVKCSGVYHLVESGFSVKKREIQFVLACPSHLSNCKVQFEVDFFFCTGWEADVLCSVFHVTVHQLQHYVPTGSQAWHFRCNTGH